MIYNTACVSILPLWQCSLEWACNMLYMDIMRNLLSTTAFPSQGVELQYTEHLSSLQALVHLIVLHCITLHWIQSSLPPIPSSHPCTHPPIPHSQAVLYSARITNTPPPFPPPFLLPQNPNPSILLITKPPLPRLQNPRKPPLGAPKTEKK